jgi:hypothetical protein
MYDRSGSFSIVHLMSQRLDWERYRWAFPWFVLRSLGLASGVQAAMHLTSKVGHGGLLLLILDIQSITLMRFFIRLSSTAELGSYGCVDADMSILQRCRPDGIDSSIDRSYCSSVRCSLINMRKIMHLAGLLWSPAKPSWVHDVRDLNGTDHLIT